MIRTVRNSKWSLFQSLVDDVVTGKRHDAPSGDATRPTVADPTVHAATLFAEKKDAGEPVPASPPPEMDVHGADKAAWECVRLAGELFDAKLRGDAARARQLEDELDASTCDPRWAEAVTEYVDYFGPGGEKREPLYVPWKEIGDFVLPVLPRNARIAVVGDWGTGTDEADALLAEVAKRRPQVLVHLGDVYYSGTKREAHDHFLTLLDRHFPRAAGEVPVYNLTGNHDMYAGGVGFYDVLPATNPSPPFPPEAAQAASYFCLRSPGGRWQVLGMDTGLHDHDPFTVDTDVTYLEDREVEWHRDKLRGFAGKTILLSHHQLFSAYSEIGKGAAKPAGQEAWNPKLLAAFADDLAAGRVPLWLWGHEHNLCVYQPAPVPGRPGATVRGRCVGHGAIPVFTSQNPYTALDLPDLPPLVAGADGEPLELAADADGVYAHGYVVLDLDDDHGTAEVAYYVEGQDDPVHVERID